jgi:hypothetical protein
MILVHQRYYAKPGMSDAVLRTRQKANRILQELGLDVGRIYVLGVEQAGAPDVIWECTYQTLEERQEVEQILDTSPAFQAVRNEQGSQVDQFVREYFEELT